jgi:hypothetical protein
LQHGPGIQRTPAHILSERSWRTRRGGLVLFLDERA